MADQITELADTVARLDERGKARDVWQTRIETLIAAQSAEIASIVNDVRAAKVALSLGGLLSKVLMVSGGGVAGWVASHLGK